MCRDFRLVATCGSPSRSLPSPTGVKEGEMLALTSGHGSQSLAIVGGIGPLDEVGPGLGHVPSCAASCSLASTYLADSRGQIQHSDRVHYTVSLFFK